MKRKITIKEKVIHVVDRALTAAEKEAEDITYQIGRMGGPEVHDPRLESHEVRKNLHGREGKICLGVRAGEKLGDISIAIQFEGPVDTGHGEPDLCMEGQNALLTKASDWIAEVLGDLDAEFEGVIEAEPCPKATKPLAVQEAAQIMSQTVESKIKRDEDVSVKVG